MSACGAKSTPLDLWPDSGTRSDVSISTGHDQGSGGMGGAPYVPVSEPSSCAPGYFLAYTQPGCGADVKRTCLNGAAGACATEACSCNGEAVYGSCNGGFSERFTRDRSCISPPVVAPPPVPHDEDAGAVSSDLDGGSSEAQCQVDDDCVLVGKGCCYCAALQSPENVIATSKAQQSSVQHQMCPVKTALCVDCANARPDANTPKVTPVCHEHQCAILTLP